MSYFGAWPTYKVARFRGTGELLFKAMRASWKVDRVLVPLLIVPLIFSFKYKSWGVSLGKEKENPYSEAILKKKSEGAYDGNNVGIRPHHYS